MISAKPNIVAKWLVNKKEATFKWALRPVIDWMRPYVERGCWWAINTPNIITVVRLVVGVWIAFRIYTATSTSSRIWWVVAIVVLIISDGVDGTLARELGIVTTFGMIMDPAGDKALTGSLIIGLAFTFSDKLFGITAPLLIAIEIGNTVFGLLHFRQPITAP